MSSISKCLHHFHTPLMDYLNCVLLHYLRCLKESSSGLFSATGEWLKAYTQVLETWHSWISPKPTSLPRSSEVGPGPARGTCFPENHSGSAERGRSSCRLLETASAPLWRSSDWALGPLWPAARCSFSTVRRDNPCYDHSTRLPSGLASAGWSIPQHAPRKWFITVTGVLAMVDQIIYIS